VTEQQRKFISDIDHQCQSHEDWLALVRYAMDKLIEDQDVLTELIAREAVRQAGRSREAGHLRVQELRGVMAELGLRLTATDGGREQ
jgi:hypothetical protein